MTRPPRADRSPDPSHAPPVPRSAPICFQRPRFRRHRTASEPAPRWRTATAALSTLVAAATLQGTLDRPDPPAACSAPAEVAAWPGHGPGGLPAWTAVATCRASGATTPVRGPAVLLFGGRIDPNRADAALLEVLPGIGPVRAHGIVAARETRRFENVGDLQRVHGIGPATVAQLHPYLAVAAGTPPAPPSAGASLPEQAKMDAAQAARVADTRPCTGPAAPQEESDEACRVERRNGPTAPAASW